MASPKAQKEFERGVKAVTEGVASDNAISHRIVSKTWKPERIEEAQTTATEALQSAGTAGTTAAEAVRRAEEGDLGYLNVTQLFREGKIGDVALYNGTTRLYFEDLLVKSAQIQDLLADKINLTNALSWPGGRLDMSGVKLNASPLEAEDPALNTTRKITPFGDFGGLEFPSQSGVRGTTLHGVGSTGLAGRVQFLARNSAAGTSTTPATANAYLQSEAGGRGFLRLVDTDLRAEGNSLFGGNITAQSSLHLNLFVGPTTIGAGQSQPFNHSSLFNTPARWIVLQYRTPGGWRPIANDVDFWEIRAQDGVVTVANLTSSAREVRGYINQ